jgi:hypothetical protein
VHASSSTTKKPVSFSSMLGASTLIESSIASVDK